MKRLWFRLFRRDSASTLLDVLSTGDTPSPNPEGTTRQNEIKLGIEPPHVYAYLSRLNPDFGSIGVALEFDCGEGSVSPFDTGGLIKHIEPVNGWDDEKRREALEKYTWASGGIDALLASWPASDWEPYVDGNRPSGKGPHDKLKVAFDLPIWEPANNQWQAWVWELRQPALMPFGRKIERWTCPPQLYQELVALGRTDPSLREAILMLVSRYVPGGVSVLFDACRALP